MIAFGQRPDALDHSIQHSATFLTLKLCRFAGLAGVLGLAIAKVTVCV